LARVIFFIDGSNMFWGLRDYQRKIRSRVHVDYPKLVQELANSREIRGKYYYCSEPAIVGASQTKFMDMLRTNGFTVVPKKLKTRGGSRNVEKGVDVALVTDLLSLAWEKAYEDAVIVSGDADYADAIKYVKQKGIMVQIVAWSGSFSQELKRVANDVIYLDNLMDKVKL
jgi:uncharacterized LabA/DUF88 family protein